MTYKDVNNHNHISHLHANHGNNSLAKKIENDLSELSGRAEPWFPVSCFLQPPDGFAPLLHGHDCRPVQPFQCSSGEFFFWQGWQNAWQGRVNYIAMAFVARWNHIENFPLLQAASRMYFNSQFFNHSGMGGVMGGHTVSIRISITKLQEMFSWMSAQVGQHPSGQHGSVQHSMNMLYMDSLQRGDQCSPGEWQCISRMKKLKCQIHKFTSECEQICKLRNA